MSFMEIKQDKSIRKDTNMKPRISMITLGVENLEKSVKFYKEGLGFPKMNSPPEVAFFTRDCTCIFQSLTNKKVTTNAS